METDDDKDLSLRDKLAMAALPALVRRFDGGRWISNGKPTEEFAERAEQIALLAYKLADELRKARLKSFT